MLSIAICDDDVLLSGRVEQALHKLAAEHGIAISCEAFSDGVSLVQAVTEQRMYFDLVYLDIEMVHMNGICTAQTLRELEHPVLIVYLSGHEKYLKELFDTEPFRFLSKPIDQELFRKVFFDACDRIRKCAGIFTFCNNKSYYKVPFKRIKYFESNKRVISIYMENGYEENNLQQNSFYGKMNDIEKKVASVNGRFLRIHQSYLVNFDYIQKYTPTEIMMLDGKRLRISEDRRKSVQTRMLVLFNEGEGN